MPRIQKNLAYLILGTVGVMVISYLNDPARFTDWYNANEPIITAIATVGSVLTILYIAVYSAQQKR